MNEAPDSSVAANNSSDPDLALPQAVPVSRDSTAGVAILAHFRIQTAALLEAERGIADDRPDAVHSARVAARRLRSGLRIYGDLFVGDVDSALRPELAWYASRLAPARDLEVFIELLESGRRASITEANDSTISSEDERLVTALVPWLRAQHSQAVASAAADVRSDRAGDLRVQLRAAANTPRYTRVASRRASKVLAPRVLAADRKATRALEKLEPTDASEEWHAVRIAAKRARYAAEVGAPVFGKSCQHLARLWASVSEPLGLAQDAVIQQDLVRRRIGDAAFPLTAAEAFACGVLVASSREREARAQLLTKGLWREAKDEHRQLARGVK